MRGKSSGAGGDEVEQERQATVAPGANSTKETDRPDPVARGGRGRAGRHGVESGMRCARQERKEGAGAPGTFWAPEKAW